MRKLFYVFFLMGLVSDCAPAVPPAPVVPIEAGKNPACVKACESKRKECVAGARYASASAVAERCYEGYEVCVKACKP